MLLIKKNKENNVKSKESKFYVINFIDLRIFVFKINTTYNEIPIQISYEEGKTGGRKEICARTVNGSEQLSLSYIDFFKCSSMLNTAPVTNAFLSYTGLSKCFFLKLFFLLPEYIFILQAI